MIWTQSNNSLLFYRSVSPANESTNSSSWLWRRPAKTWLLVDQITVPWTTPFFTRLGNKPQVKLKVRIFCRGCPSMGHPSGLFKGTAVQVACLPRWTLLFESFRTTYSWGTLVVNFLIFCFVLQPLTKSITQKEIPKSFGIKVFI